MSDTKIQRLRGIADWLGVMGWTNMATNVRDAADELERLYKIEAAAVEWLHTAGPEALKQSRLSDALVETLRSNPCQTA